MLVKASCAAANSELVSSSACWTHLAVPQSSGAGFSGTFGTPAPSSIAGGTKQMLATTAVRGAGSRQVRHTVASGAMGPSLTTAPPQPTRRKCVTTVVHEELELGLAAH